MLIKIEHSIDGVNKVVFGNGLLTSEIYTIGRDLIMGEGN